MTAFDPAKLRLTIARQLRDIEQLALDLHAQALNDANARDFPGGTALHMLGPAASIAVWEAQYEATEAAERWDDNGADRWAKRPKLDPAIYQGDDNEQPLNVLESWTRIIREERDQPTGLKATISREVDYLRGAIDWICAVDEFGEPQWPAVVELTSELRMLVRRMEDVTHEGLRVERTRVTCTHCEDKARLVYRYRSGVRLDEFRCPECREPYDYGQFVRAYHQNLADEGAEKFILATDAQKSAQIPIQTMRSWMRRMTVITACDIETKRIIVWWPDVRLLMERRRRERNAS